MSTSAVAGFPTTTVIKDGQVVIRPMVADDRDPLLDFFRRIPDEDRLYLKDDVTSPEVIARWVAGLDYSRVLPLLAWDGSRIVGDGTLHRSRSEARRHVGELRVVIDPEYRNRGVGRTLLRSLIDVARRDDAQLEKLVFNVVSDTEQAAIHTAQALGFAKVATFSSHVRYYQGEPHDLDVYELQLAEALDLDDPAAHMY